MSAPSDALRDLAALLRADESVVSPHVADPSDGPPVLGALAAAGERTAAAPGEYALVVEAVREGYLLHYAPGRARIVGDVDGDLALLAGDYLYALGLERLAALGDLAAVRELSELISLAAQVHDGSRPPERARPEATGLWLACAAAIAGGGGPAHDRAKGEVRAEQPRPRPPRCGPQRSKRPRPAGSGSALEDAAAGLDFRSDHLSSLG